MKLQGAPTPRPMTHDLVTDMLGELNAKCEQIAVTELRDNTFYASITLRWTARRSRSTRGRPTRWRWPSASRAPIFVADQVIDDSAIEFGHEVEDTEEVVDEFKDFLDEVSAPRTCLRRFLIAE